MCTKKRKTNVPKEVFIATNISKLLSNQIPVKYKDPGYPTISYTTSQAKINEHVLIWEQVSICSPSQHTNNLGKASLALLKLRSS